MHEAAATEFPFMADPAFTKREKSRLARLWEHFQEVKAAVAQHGVLMPQTYAADLLGVTKQRVFTLVEQGRLTTVMIGGRRYVTEASMMEFAKSERASGRHLTVPGVRETFRKALDASRELAEKK